MKLYGKEIDNKEILKYIGNTQQIMGLKKYRMSDGFADGVECVDIKTGAGLVYTVVLSRALDISFAEYRGDSLTHISPIGAVAPAYFDASGDEWLRSFGVGMLTSVGIDQAGGPCESDGRWYGQHGRLSNIPARNIALHEDFTNNGFEMSVTGEMCQWKQVEQNLFLRRKISSIAGDNTIYIHDTYENRGYEKSPFMILYHFNIGFPFLNEKTEFIIPNTGVSSMYPDRPVPEKTNVTGPIESKEEDVFHYETKADDEGYSYALAISNGERPNIGLLWKFPHEVLPICTQWLQMSYQDYVVGIEPCNNYVNGVAAAKNQGTLKYIYGQESVDIDISLKVVEGESLHQAIKFLLEL